MGFGGMNSISLAPFTPCKDDNKLHNNCWVVPTLITCLTVPFFTQRNLIILGSPFVSSACTMLFQQQWCKTRCGHETFVFHWPYSYISYTLIDINEQRRRFNFAYDMHQEKLEAQRHSNPEISMRKY